MNRPGETLVPREPAGSYPLPWRDHSPVEQTEQRNYQELSSFVLKLVSEGHLNESRYTTFGSEPFASLFVSQRVSTNDPDVQAYLLTHFVHDVPEPKVSEQVRLEIKGTQVQFVVQNEQNQTEIFTSHLSDEAFALIYRLLHFSTKHRSSIDTAPVRELDRTIDTAHYLFAILNTAPLPMSFSTISRSTFHGRANKTHYSVIATSEPTQISVVVSEIPLPGLLSLLRRKKESPSPNVRRFIFSFEDDPDSGKILQTLTIKNTELQPPQSITIEINNYITSGEVSISDAAHDVSTLDDLFREVPRAIKSFTLPAQQTN